MSKHGECIVGCTRARDQLLVARNSGPSTGDFSDDGSREDDVTSSEREAGEIVALFLTVVEIA